MRFLVAGGAPHGGSPGDWGGHVWHAAWHLHDYIQQRAGESVVHVDVARVEAFLDEAAGYDGVLCESRMALILAHEWARRGQAPRVVLALQVHSLDPARAVRDWYLRSGRGDPWPALVAARSIAWLAPTSRQQAGLLDGGIEPARVHRFRVSASIFSLLMPAAEARIARSGSGGAAADARVVMPGTGRRDWATCLRAAVELDGVPCTFIGGKRANLDRHLAAQGASWPRNLTHVEAVPIGDFIDAVGSARVVAVALLAGEGDGGHTTVALANRAGVPLVCSDSPTLREYCEPGITCLTAPPGDGPALAAAVRRAWSDESLREALVREGRRFERQLDARFVEDLRGAIDQASRGLA